jgi:hypothetical protein
MVLNDRLTKYGIYREIWTGKIILEVIKQRWGIWLPLSCFQFTEEGSVITDLEQLLQALARFDAITIYASREFMIRRCNTN